MIAGVPRTPDEIVTKIIITVCAALGVTISENDLSNCYRQGHQVRVNAKGESMPPTIMVEFTRELVKASILAAAKKGKKAKTLTSTDIGFNVMPPSKIYVNERLTPYNHTILKEALMLKSKNSLRYVWTNGGFVHGRVEDSAPTLLFNSIEELYRKLGICHPIGTAGGTPLAANINADLVSSDMLVDPVPDLNGALISSISGTSMAESSILKRKSGEAVNSVPSKIKKTSPDIAQRLRIRQPKDKDDKKDEGKTKERGNEKERDKTKDKIKSTPDPCTPVPDPVSPAEIVGPPTSPSEYLST